MTAIDDKFVQFGGAAVLGAATSQETACPDKVGHFRHYENGSIYWHPVTNAHVVQGAIRNRYGNDGWERGGLGYPTTDESPAAAGGRYNHFQHGSIYWKSNLWAHRIDGLISEYWASNNWENNPELGFPISDEHATTPAFFASGMFMDFENGVVYLKAGGTKAGALFKLTLEHASKTAEQMLAAISAIITPLFSAPVQGHQLNITVPPTLSGVSDYSWDGSFIGKSPNVRNRFYEVHLEFEIVVPVVANIRVALDLSIEVFFDRASHAVKGAVRRRHTHIEVPGSTGIFESVDDVVAALKPVLDAQMNVEHRIKTIPAEAPHVLSVKVMANGDLNVYAEPLF